MPEPWGGGGGGGKGGWGRMGGGAWFPGPCPGAAYENGMLLDFTP